MSSLDPLFRILVIGDAKAFIQGLSPTEPTTAATAPVGDDATSDIENRFFEVNNIRTQLNMTAALDFLDLKKKQKKFTGSQEFDGVIVAISGENHSSNLERLGTLLMGLARSDFHRLSRVQVEWNGSSQSPTKEVTSLIRVLLDQQKQQRQSLGINNLTLPEVRAQFIQEAIDHLSQLRLESAGCFCFFRDLKHQKAAALERLVMQLKEDVSTGQPVSLRDRIHEARVQDTVRALDAGKFSHRTRDLLNKYTQLDPSPRNLAPSPAEFSVT
jgi:hypothetical protein